MCQKKSQIEAAGCIQDLDRCGQMLTFLWISSPLTSSREIKQEFRRSGGLSHQLLLPSNFIFSVYLYQWILTSTNQCTTTSSTSTSARTKTYYTLGPALFLFEIGFRQTVGIQAVLDPALDEAPQSRKKQVVESDHDEPFKDGEVKRPKGLGGTCEFQQADHRGNRRGLKHVIEFVAQRWHNHTRRLRQHDTPHSKRK